MTDPRTSAWPTNPSAYNIVETLGTGASAEVFKAYCEPLGMYCAIKKLNVDTDSFLKEIRRELTSMSACQHENILSYYCTFVSGTSLFIVMPMMTSSISDVLHLLYPNGFDSESVIAYILQQTLQALYHLHNNRLVHRDVKASNILVATTGEVVLSDFGVAFTRSLSRNQNCTTFVGTPCFIAPEVIRFTSTKRNDDSLENEASGYDAGADIWSLGVMAIELAIGKAPASNLEPMKVLLNTVKNPAPTLQSALNAAGQEHKHFSRSFHDFITRCLKKDPQQRPSAEQLLDHKFIKSAKRKSHFAQHVMHVFESNGGVRAARAAERRRREQRIRGVPASAVEVSEPPVEEPPKTLADAVNKESSMGQSAGWDFGESKAKDPPEHVAEIPNDGENASEPQSSTFNSPNQTPVARISEAEDYDETENSRSNAHLVSSPSTQDLLQRTASEGNTLDYIGVVSGDPKVRMQQLNGQLEIGAKRYSTFAVLVQYNNPDPSEEYRTVKTVETYEELYKHKKKYYNEHKESLREQRFPGRVTKAPSEGPSFLVLFQATKQTENKPIKDTLSTTGMTNTPPLSHGQAATHSRANSVTSEVGTPKAETRAETSVSKEKKGRFVVKKKSREPSRTHITDSAVQSASDAFSHFIQEKQSEIAEYFRQEFKKQDSSFKQITDALLERIEELEAENSKLKEDNISLLSQLKSTE